MMWWWWWERGRNGGHFSRRSWLLSQVMIWLTLAFCQVISYNMKLISYNMHGFYRGCPGIDDAIIPNNPDLFHQEHWLTPLNLLLPENRFTDYFLFWMFRHVHKCWNCHATWSTSKPPQLIIVVIVMPLWRSMSVCSLIFTYHVLVLQIDTYCVTTSLVKLMLGCHVIMTVT